MIVHDNNNRYLLIDYNVPGTVLVAIYDFVSYSQLCKFVTNRFPSLQGLRCLITCSRLIQVLRFKPRSPATKALTPEHFAGKAVKY